MQSASSAPHRQLQYTRRVPEETVLYGVVADQLTTFLAHAERSGRSVPAFVERELSRYLECGILAYGFLTAVGGRSLFRDPLSDHQMPN